MTAHHPLISPISGDVFVMEASALEAFLTTAAGISPEMISRLDLGDPEEGPGYEVSRDGTATIRINGVLLRAGASMYRAFGIEATSYDELSAAIRAAEGDPAARRILLSVDSPGGQASGVHAAADAIFHASKPVAAHVQTMAASGGYWLASQAQAGITASRGAQVGSIGAYTVVVDISERAKASGVKVHVLSSGPYKGAGVPGTEISEAQLAEVQARINKLADEFVADVARGRDKNVTDIRASADGRVYDIADSVTRGLIDRISADPEKDRKMADAADRKSYAALIREFPAHAAVVAEALEAGTDIAAVRSRIEKAEADKVAAAREAEMVKVKADLEAAVKADGEKAAKITALEGELAAAKTAHDALKALADGAKPGNKVAGDPPAQKGPTATAKAVNDMTPIQRTAFYQGGGTVEG
jgi:signal peptide peptidase SppA